VYHPRKIFENSDAKLCILVTTRCDFFCFLKTTAIVSPPT